MLQLRNRTTSTTRFALLALSFLSACSRAGKTDAPQATVTTVALPAPGQNEPALEPHLSIDASHPNRVFVGAQYGTGYNGGGRNIWEWSTPDGGKNWTGGDVALPWANADLAADAVTALGADGDAYLASVVGDMKNPHSAVVLARADSVTGALDSARVVAQGRLADSLGVVDKPWVAVDRSRSSSRRGTVYVAWHLQKPRGEGDTRTTLWVASSTDSGRAFGKPVRVADRASGHMTVRRDGVLEIVYVDSSERTLLRTRSDDGGKSFSPPDTAITLIPPARFDLAEVAALGGDTSVVCWAEGAPNERRRMSRCATSTERGTWSAPVDVAPGAGTAASVSHPSVGASFSGIWVAAYRSDSASTSVVLYNSKDGGRTFTEHTRFGSRPFGLDHFCSSPAADCRRAPPAQGVFFPGDYLAISALDYRIAVAYVLPEGDAPTGRPGINVSIVRFPRPK